MHELSIVLSIVDSAKRVVNEQGGTEVKRIELEIGELAGIEWSSFDFAWAPAVRDTVLDKAERVVHRISGQAICSECSTHFHREQLFDECPVCHSFLHQLKSGKELKIKSLTII